MDRKTIRTLETALAVQAAVTFAFTRALWSTEVLAAMLFYSVCALLLAVGADLATGLAAENRKWWRLLALYCALLVFAGLILAGRFPDAYQIREALKIFVSALFTLSVFGIISDVRDRRK